MPGYKVLSDYTFTLERGTAWGTKIETAPVGMPTEDMTFTFEGTPHRLNRAWNIRGQHESNTWQDTFNNVPSASTSIIMTPELMAMILPGLLQKDSDWTATVDVWDMFTNNYVDLPSIKGADEGYFYTLVRNSPASGDDEIIDSAIISSMKLMIGHTDNDGVLKADIEMIGIGYSSAQTAAGTITHASLAEMFNWGAISAVSFGASDLTSDFISAEINISNGAKLAQDLPTGEVVLPRWEVTGTIKIIANALTEAMKVKCLNNDVDSAEPLTITFGNAAPAANGDMNIVSHCYLTGWSSDFGEGEVIDFQFEGVFGVSAGEYPIGFEFFYA